jgi:NTP pyrophosphatase (non-canonical NTP hydrolase)
MTFREYQREALRTDRTAQNDLKHLMVPLLGLAGEVGSLLSEYKKWLREGEAYRPFKDQVSEEIGDILWYLANLASKASLDFGEIAQENLAKLKERWPTVAEGESSLFPREPHRFDAAFPPEERLPLQLRVDFIEEAGPTGPKLILRYNGNPLGDPLTDNSHVEDGYRYHDVFHLACGVLLGWSPIMRRLFKCKRKSVPALDEVEDGARAFVTEEAVSAVVFGYARDHSMFASSTSIDYELLRTVRGMTRPFEVRSRSLADWQQMILASYRVWRHVIENHGGTFIGDASAGKIDFEPPSSQTAP